MYHIISTPVGMPRLSPIRHVVPEKGRRLILRASLMLSLVVVTSPVQAEQYEATGLSQPCSSQCADKLDGMREEALAEAMQKTRGAKVIGAPQVECWIVDPLHYITQCTAKVIYDIKKTRASSPDCDSNPYTLGCPRSGVGTLTPPARSSAQIECEQDDRKWVNGECKPWCYGRPPSTPTRYGGFCGGD